MKRDRTFRFICNRSYAGAEILSHNRSVVDRLSAAALTVVGAPIGMRLHHIFTRTRQRRRLPAVTLFTPQRRRHKQVKGRRGRNFTQSEGDYWSSSVVPSSSLNTHASTNLSQRVSLFTLLEAWARRRPSKVAYSIDNTPLKFDRKLSSEGCRRPICPCSSTNLRPLIEAPAGSISFTCREKNFKVKIA